MNHTLTTARLTLTPVTPADESHLRAHWTAPDVRRYLFDGATLTDQQITQTITDSTTTFTTAGYGLWTIRAHHSPDLVGTTGLRPLDDAGIEILYSLSPTAWGHGYATEATHAVLDHGLTTLGLPEILAEVDEGNTASAKVITRLGMTPYATIPGKLGPMTRYRLTR